MKKSLVILAALSLSAQAATFSVSGVKSSGFIESYNLSFQASHDSSKEKKYGCVYIMAITKQGQTYFATNAAGTGTASKWTYYSGTGAIAPAYCPLGMMKNGQPIGPFNQTESVTLFNGQSAAQFGNAKIYAGYAFSYQTFLSSANYSMVANLNLVPNKPAAVAAVNTGNSLAAYPFSATAPVSTYKPVTVAVVTQPVVTTTASVTTTTVKPVVQTSRYKTVASNGVEVLRMPGSAPTYTVMGMYPPYQIQTSCADQVSPNGYYPGTTDIPAPDSWTTKINIVGGTAFKCQVRNALYMLEQRAPEVYAMVLKYIDNIQYTNTEGSGMYPDTKTFMMLDTYTTVFFSVTWTTGLIAHDAWHSKLFWDWHDAHPGQATPWNVWTGTAAEADCMVAQGAALIKVGAPGKGAPTDELGMMKVLLPNSYDLNGNGYLDAYDIANRTW